MPTTTASPPSGVVDEAFPSSPREAAGPRHAPSDSAYGFPFWSAYVANTAIVISHSILFRFADFIAYLDGSEYELGAIVGLGMVGSLGMRIFQGVAIDQYGSRRIWLISLLIYVGSLPPHLLLTDSHGVSVYLLRIIYSTSLAGALGATITAMSLRVPPRRMSEMLAVLGSSGFVGMIVGPTLGDYLVSEPPVGFPDILRMFLGAGVFGVISLVAAHFATRGEPVRRSRRRVPPLLGILRRYRPGMILLAGAAMGIGVGLPQTFLRTFAASLEIHKIAVFFVVYAPTAFVVRISMRNWPTRYGNRPFILAGFGFMMLGLLAFLAVEVEWQLAFPAALMGSAHAFLFPTVIAEGSRTFPDRYRGIGTTLILGTVDLGILVGAPAAGAIVTFAQSQGWPPYPVMFVSMTLALTVMVVLYAREAPPRRAA